MKDGDRRQKSQKNGIVPRKNGAFEVSFKIFYAKVYSFKYFNNYRSFSKFYLLVMSFLANFSNFTVLSLVYYNIPCNVSLFLIEFHIGVIMSIKVIIRLVLVCCSLSACSMSSHIKRSELLKSDNHKLEYIIDYLQECPSKWHGLLLMENYLLALNRVCKY